MRTLVLLELLVGGLALPAIVYCKPDEFSSDVVLASSAAGILASYFLIGHVKQSIIDRKALPQEAIQSAVALPIIFLFLYALVSIVGFNKWLFEPLAATIASLWAVSSTVNSVWLYDDQWRSDAIRARLTALALRAVASIAALIAGELVWLIVATAVASVYEAGAGCSRLLVSNRAVIGSRVSYVLKLDLGASQTVARLDSFVFRVIFERVFGAEVATLAVAENLAGGLNAIQERYFAGNQIIERRLIVLTMIIGVISGTALVCASIYGISGLVLLGVVMIGIVPMSALYKALRVVNQNRIAYYAIVISCTSIVLKAVIVLTRTERSFILLSYLFAPIVAFIAYTSLAKNR